MMTNNSTCEIIQECEFFIYEMRIESIANRFKSRYCFSCKDACARYMIFRASDLGYIPPDLYPNEYDKALDILAHLPQ